jgi:hypothetical protein
MPSTTSVPTGLAAPKMLFSPIMRELRDDHRDETAQRHPPQLIYDRPQPAAGPSRRRAVSLSKPQSQFQPQTQSRPPVPSHQYDKLDRTRWAAPTMCDMLVFPRPHITALTITPPISPDNDRVTSMFDNLSMADRVDRDKERDEWHKFVEKRARSRSFRIGGLGNGNVSGDEGLLRRDTRSKSRARSASAGAGPSRKSSRAKSDKAKQHVDDPNSAPPVSTSFGLTKTSRSSRDAESHRHADLGDDPFSYKPTEAERYKSAHHYTKSSPDLSALPRDRVRVAPPRPSQDDGVVVIGPGRQAPRSRPPIPHRSFTKPLPPLPAEYRLQYSPSSPFKPFEPKTEHTVSPSRLPTRQPLIQSEPLNSAISADSVSASAKPSRRSHELSPADARAMIAKQHQRAVNKRAFNSPRPRQHRDSEGSNYSQASTSARDRTSTLSAVSPLRRMTAMEEAIGRSRAASVGSRLQVCPVEGLSNTSSLNTSGSSSSTARPAVRAKDPISAQTTPRMRQVSSTSDTPSPRNQNHEDFKVCRALLPLVTAY